MAIRLGRKLFNWRTLIILALTTGILVATRPVRGCGPFSLRQVFSFEKHPDFPLQKFAAGEIGVLQPTYARSYLFVAYRYFTGAPLDGAEQKATTAIWDERLQGGWESPGDDWIKTWTDARAKVLPAAKTDISVFRSLQKNDLYINYVNCPADGFKNAATTLNRLIEKYGAASKEANDWVATQDQIFASCGQGQAAIAAAEPAASAVIRANRAYQIAAASFYAGNFDQAESQFNAIAADASSPWRQIAPYLVARTLIRKGTLSGGHNEDDRTALAQAEAQLRKVLADKNQSVLHRSARGLLGFVRLRLAPEGRLKELTAALLKKTPSPDFRQDLIDYTRLLDRLVGDDDESTDNEKSFAKLPTIGRDDDLTDWALTFQVTDNQALDHAIQQWEKTGSIPWLVAALTKVSSTNPKAAPLIEAGARIKPSSPAFASVMYHTVRLNIEAGRRDAARKLLDGLLAANAAALPPSAFNQFMSLRTRVAANLEEFLKYSQRVPAGFTYDEDGRELPVSSEADATQPAKTPRNKLSWDADSTRALNVNMPVSVLKEAVLSTTLPSHLRRELALAVWVRAALLDDDDTAAELTPTVASLVPELKGVLGAYTAAPDKPAKKFAAVYLILNNPGARPEVNPGSGRMEELAKIENYRDNWWCEYGKAADAPSGSAKPAKALAPSPSFLTAAQKATGAAEWKRLAALGTAPNYLCAQAVNWANTNPVDPRAPEALHLAVRATRYGCTNEQTGALSKQAYDTLHRKYPKSEWAQKTKYWYKD